jgi:hypothetical protein
MLGPIGSRIWERNLMLQKTHWALGSRDEDDRDGTKCRADVDETCKSRDR